MLAIKRVLTPLLIALFAINSFAQQDTTKIENTSDNIDVYLLTCSPGDELYSVFGHSAIRVNDLVFNYGVFNFDTEGFYLKFISGQTDYELGVEMYEDFDRHYRNHNRGVTEQKLNLDKEEKEALFAALLDNARSENKTYRYNFVFDNCATRPRVKIEDCVKGSISYAVEDKDETYRELIGQYVGEDSWTKFGIDLLIGADADRKADFWNRLFLPNELMNAFAKAKRRNNGQNLVTATNETVVKDISETTSEDDNLISPVATAAIVMTLICLATLLFPKKMKIVDFFFFLATGILGTLIFYLTFFSLHPLVGGNYNLLWLNPIHLAIPILVFVAKAKKLLIGIYAITAILSIISISGYIFLPQEFNIAFLPIMVIILVRAYSAIKTLREI